MCVANGGYEVLFFFFFSSCGFMAILTSHSEMP